MIGSPNTTLPGKGGQKGSGFGAAWRHSLFHSSTDSLLCPELTQSHLGLFYSSCLDLSARAGRRDKNALFSVRGEWPGRGEELTTSQLVHRLPGQGHPAHCTQLQTCPHACGESLCSTTSDRGSSQRPEKARSHLYGVFHREARAVCSPSNHLHVDQISLFRAPHRHRQTLVFKAFLLPATRYLR